MAIVLVDGRIYITPQGEQISTAYMVGDVIELYEDKAIYRLSIWYDRDTRIAGKTDPEIKPLVSYDKKVAGTQFTEFFSHLTSESTIAEKKLALYNYLSSAQPSITKPLEDGQVQAEGDIVVGDWESDE